MSRRRICCYVISLMQASKKETNTWNGTSNSDNSLLCFLSKKSLCTEHDTQWPWSAYSTEQTALIQQINQLIFVCRKTMARDIVNIHSDWLLLGLLRATSYWWVLIACSTNEMARKFILKFKFVLLYKTGSIKNAPLRCIFYISIFFKAFQPFFFISQKEASQAWTEIFECTQTNSQFLSVETSQIKRLVIFAVKSYKIQIKT